MASTNQRYYQDYLHSSSPVDPLFNSPVGLKEQSQTRWKSSRSSKDNGIDKLTSTDCSSDSDQAGKAKTDETKYKTEMCKNFQATGNCNYGKKCRFAHGKTDLVSKPIQTSKPYKTKTCKAFHEELNCPYGSRCHFKHDQRSVEEIFTSKFYARKLALLSNSIITPTSTINYQNNNNESNHNFGWQELQLQQSGMASSPSRLAVFTNLSLC